jgi:hypothetical protein
MPSFEELYCIHLQGLSGDAGKWRDLYRVRAIDISDLKMETVCFSKTFASTCEYTRRQYPEHPPHCFENLRSHKNLLVSDHTEYEIYQTNVYLYGLQVEYRVNLNTF